MSATEAWRSAGRPKRSRHWLNRMARVAGGSRDIQRVSLFDRPNDCSFTNIQAEIKKPSCLLRIELGAVAQDLIYLLNIHYCSFFVDSSHPTAGVSCGGWERGFTVEAEKAQSQTKAQKMRRVPTLSCTLCWAVNYSASINLSRNSFSVF